jgi:hypothetical protein
MSCILMYTVKRGHKRFEASTMRMRMEARQVRCGTVDMHEGDFLRVDAIVKHHLMYIFHGRSHTFVVCVKWIPLRDPSEVWPRPLNGFHGIAVSMRPGFTQFSNLSVWGWHQHIQSGASGF